MKNKKESVVWWSIKNAIAPSLTLGGIMAIICFLACRNDPLKENVVRVLGVIVSTFLFLTAPFVIMPLLGFILSLPIRFFDLFKKRH